MAYTSGSGTGCAAPTRGSAISRATGIGRRIAPRIGLAALGFLLLGGAAPVADLTIDVTGLRSSAGELRLCLTANPRQFPSCVGDARAIARSVPAGQREIRFAALPQGQWAVAVIHDANGNAKLDTMLGIPREGFGFSNNPPIGFGAPRFSAARFTLDTDETQTVQMKYLL